MYEPEIFNNLIKNFSKLLESFPSLLRVLFISFFGAAFFKKGRLQNRCLIGWQSGWHRQKKYCFLLAETHTPCGQTRHRRTPTETPNCWHCAPFRRISPECPPSPLPSCVECTPNYWCSSTCLKCLHGHTSNER